jgi:hypothetical protein
MLQCLQEVSMQETHYAPYPGEDDEAGQHDEDHPLPKGALVITLSYLTLLTVLWLHVYLQLLMSGGIPR